MVISKDGKLYKKRKKIKKDFLMGYFSGDLDIKSRKFNQILILEVVPDTN